MKFIIIAIITIALCSCGKVQKYEADWTGYSKVCVDNVTYLQFSSGVTTQYDINGKIVGCK